MNEGARELLLRQVEERRKDPEFMERLGRIMCDDAEVLDKLAAGQRPDAIPEKRWKALVCPVCWDGPNLGPVSGRAWSCSNGHPVVDAIEVEVVPVDPFLRAAHPGAGSEEAERRRAAHEAGMNVADAMNGEDVSVEAVVDAALDAYARPALRAAHPEADRAPEDKR